MGDDDDVRADCTQFSRLLSVAQCEANLETSMFKDATTRQYHHMKNLDAIPDYYYKACRCLGVEKYKYVPHHAPSNVHDWSPDAGTSLRQVGNVLPDLSTWQTVRPSTTANPSPSIGVQPPRRTSPPTTCDERPQQPVAAPVSPSVATSPSPPVTIRPPVIVRPSVSVEPLAVAYDTPLPAPTRMDTPLPAATRMDTPSNVSVANSSHGRVDMQLPPSDSPRTGCAALQNVLGDVNCHNVVQDADSFYCKQWTGSCAKKCCELASTNRP